MSTGNPESIELRKLQLVELDILKELDRVCRKLQLRYWLFSGTLLGAVRHKGFIPWDDDVDVIMFREDYERLQRDAPGILNKEYFLQTQKSDPGCPIFHAKLRNSQTTFIETPVSSRKMNHGIYIDIFPMDGVPNNRWVRFFGWILISAIGKVALLKSIPIKKDNLLFQLVINLVKFVPISWGTLFRLYSSLCKMVDINQSVLIAFSTWPTDPLNHIVYPKDWFDDSILLSFENNQFPVPIKYDLILKHLYGEYMNLPSMENRMPHHDAIIIDINLPYVNYMNIIHNNM